MGGDGDSSKAAEAPAGDAVITINIRASNGSKFSVQTTIESTVAAFKAALVEKCEVPVEQQRLIYKGRILKDDRTLESYGLEADHTVHLVRGSAPQPASANTGSAAGTGGTNIPNTPGFTRGPGITEGGGVGAPFGDSLFPGLGINGLNGSGVPSLFGGGFSDIEQVQQQLTQNPNIMREFMNLPAVQNLMNNPDLMRQLIMSNPQMRDLIDRNPDIAHILNDPSTLRQTIEAARNPELMREMMRNTDRAMSNIESSPEGFNMLRRMYETVQEPFLNATTMAGNPGTDVASNPFAALLGNQGQTGDRSINSSNTGSETATGTPAPNTNPLPNPWNSTAATAGGQPTNTRSAPAGDARLPSIGSLGGQGVPDMGRMFGSMQDPAFVSQFLQNPAVQQVMDSMLSNPEYMNQVLSLNPQMRAMMDANPQMREMMQNPELIRQLTSPEALQHMASLQTLLSRNRPNQEQNQTGGVTGAGNNGGLDLLMNMFGGLGTGGLGTPNPLNVPPEQLYANQLSQLQEMGFFDTQENIRALSATAGNVSAAVERLLGNPGL
ncbi:Ubiquitin-like protein-NEDD8-like protein RUB3 [Acorus calamus]|uniref:Ubiquitin-like protein-NEDD8-like protein RUB3 n=1 Tax=Acorus calamus TaxID=4465 RepID=A0AAV9DR98_ACOCL|nr:Ubiquitin-like protein-NEDD8-like protein RUB3 [Acorus calamus]